MLDISRVTVQTFLNTVGTHFKLERDSSQVECLLQSATVNSNRPVGLAREPFSLIFQSNSQEYIPQRKYRLQHPQLGVLEMFLVPIGKTETGITLQAVFS